MSEQEQDKTEQATPFKLKEAKKRAQVAKSLEVNSWFVLTSFLLVLYIWGQVMIKELAHVMSTVFSFGGKLNFSPDELVLWLGQVFMAVVSIFSPLVVVLFIIAILMNFFQTGPIFSFHPIKPDFKKLNPVTGFKRIFSLRTVYETFKSLIKLALLGAIVYFFIMGLLPKFIGFNAINPDVYPFLFLNYVEDLVLQLIILLLFIALIDLVYSKRDFSEKMKMSRREVKDEVKRREGDPQVRAKIKELQQEASKRAQSVNRVPDADVLITNPTHKSIAIKYDQNSMQAPVVIAKGAGDLALKLRQIANKKRVPIIENKALAKALFRQVEIDQEVPVNFYAEIAKILVSIYSKSEMVKPR
ncbi:MAG: flagellar biosynthesis protein FlhB [Gammaproteobacteria bacterium]|nr:flagellar biosynthesis protein FlhB [Gammaproteobacteria bacterium]